MLDFEAGHESRRNADAAAEGDHGACRPSGEAFVSTWLRISGIVGGAGGDVGAKAEDPLHPLGNGFACVLRILRDGADGVAIGGDEIVGVGSRIAGASIGREIFISRDARDVGPRAEPKLELRVDFVGTAGLGRVATMVLPRRSERRPRWVGLPTRTSQ